MGKSFRTAVKNERTYKSIEGKLFVDGKDLHHKDAVFSKIDE